VAVMSRPFVHIRFKTPTGWRNFYLHPESAYNQDVLKQIQDKFGATEFQIVEDGPVLAKPEEAVYQGEKFRR